MKWKTLEDHAIAIMLMPEAARTSDDQQLIELAVNEVMKMRQVSKTQALRVLMDLAEHYQSSVFNIPLQGS